MIDNYKVQRAIVIDVCRSDARRVRSGHNRRLTGEGSRRRLQEDGQAVVAFRYDRNVLVSIKVKVGDDKRRRLRAGIHRCLWSQHGPGIQQHSKLVVSSIDNNEIQIVHTIDVGYGESVRLHSDGNR